MWCPRNNWRFDFLLSAARRGTARLDLLQGLAAAREFGLDRFDGGSPDEGVGVFVPSFKELGNGSLKVRDARKGAAPYGFGSEFAEPAFNQVEPAGAGGDKVRDKAGVALQPCLHVGVLVSAVVVHHQVQGDLAGEFHIQAAQEFQKLLVTVPAIALADDLALQNFQGGEQTGGAIALVVVGHRAQTPFLHGQPRLGAVQSLDLGLLVHAQHQGLVGRIQVQPHHVGQLLQKLGIARELEALRAVRLQLVAAPDVADRGLAHALGLRHLPAAPLSHPLGLGRERRLNDLLDLSRGVGRLASTPRCDLPQTLWTGLDNPITPQRDGLRIDTEVLTDRQIGLTGRRRQHDPAAQRHLLRRPMRAHPRLQLFALNIRKTHSRARSGHESA